MEREIEPLSYNKPKRKKDKKYPQGLEVFILIKKFFKDNKKILSKLKDYKQILEYIGDAKNFNRSSFKYKNEDNYKLDLDLNNLAFINLEKANKYQYIRKWIKESSNINKIIYWQENGILESTKRKLKGKHVQFIKKVKSKITTELKTLFIIEYEKVLEKILQPTLKKIWISLKENFSYSSFYTFITGNEYYFRNSPANYIDRIKNLYIKYLYIKDIELGMDGEGFTNEKDYKNILGIFPEYFYDILNYIPQSSFLDEQEISVKYFKEQEILNNTFNNLKISKDDNTNFINFYTFFMDNKVLIIQSLDILLERFLMIKDNPKITQSDKDFYDELILNKKNILLLAPDIYLIYNYFYKIPFKSFMEKIFSLSPLKHINLISKHHTYKDEDKENQRQGILSYSINNITNIEEFLGKIFSNLDNLFELTINDNKLTEEEKNKTNPIFQIILNKKNKINNSSYELTFSTQFDSINNMKKNLKSQILKNLFQMEIIISYYTSQLQKDEDLFDISFDTTSFKTAYRLKDIGEGFNYLTQRMFIEKIKADDCVFNEEGYIYNPSNQDKKCFIYCMSWLGFSNIEQVFKSMGIDDYEEKGVSYNDIKALSLNQSLQFTIYDEELGTNIYIGDTKHTHYKLIHRKKHFLAFSKLNIKGKRKKKTLPIRLVFFDLETLCHYTTRLLYPLSNFYFYINEEDFKNFNFEKNKDLYEKNCSFNHNLNYIYTEINNPLNKMINDVLIWSETYEVKLIGYNSSAFDMFFVMDALKSKLQENFEVRKNCSIFIAKNRIYQLRYRNLKSFDLYLHLRMSLFDACNAFKTNPIKLKEEGEKVIDILQKTYENNTLFSYFSKELKNLELYNKIDVMCLCSLLKNYNDMINKLKPFKNYKVWDYMSLPSMINNYFQKNIYPEENYDIAKPKNRIDYLNFKSSSCAGIVGLFGKCIYSKKIENVYLLDIVSQYPYVCIEKDFPCGEYTFKIYLDGNEPNLTIKLGIYKCNINTHSLYLPIVGKKNDNNTNSWNTQKNKNYIRWITTPEINYLRKKECFVEILEGYTFLKKDKIFKGFMEPIAKKKIKLDRKGKENLTEGESVLRTLYKLILNATTGAVNQKLYETETIITDDGFVDVINLKINPDYELLEEKYLNKNVSRPYLGNYIYAYARLLICEVVNEIEEENKRLGNKESCVLYGDTDSVILTELGLKIWKTLNSIKDRICDKDDKEKKGKFGYFICEGFFTNGYLIDKKIYCLYNLNNCYPKCLCKLETVKKGECDCKNKYRLKGIGQGVDIDKNGYYIIPIKEQNKILNDEIKKALDKECEDLTLNYIENTLNIEIKEENKIKIFELYEKNYYPKMRELESRYFNSKNRINNMRDIQIYELLYNSYQFKAVRENMLDRKVSNNYKIKQITKEILFSPNTIEYDKLKVDRQFNKSFTNLYKSLNKCNIY
jgi:hypothetical protein